MTGRVLITGAGIISSIGMDLEEAFSSLLASSPGIGRITTLETTYRDEIPVAEVKADNESLMKMAGAGTGPFSRTSLLGIIAAKQALLNAHVEPGKYRTGLVSATTVGGMDRSEKFCREYFTDNTRGRLREIITHDLGDSTEKIAAACGISDFLTTISTACSSSANAIMTGARLIRSGKLDRVIAGGTDALSVFTLNGFNSLQILDREGCRPFDDTRNGLTLGEAAAYVVLESEEVVMKEGKKALCGVTGYGNACDAFHQTASSPEGDGAFLSMNKALFKAGLVPEDIDYINVHGTGTRNNDLSEGRAMERIFGGKVPPFSSTKGFTGHTLGAAGAVEAVFCMLAISRNIIWPSPGFSKRMNELNIEPVTSCIKDKTVRNVLSNSFGFGGNNTSLIFSSC